MVVLEGKCTVKENHVCEPRVSEALQPPEALTLDLWSGGWTGKVSRLRNKRGRF